MTMRKPKAFFTGLDEINLVPSQDFDGEMACPACEVPYYGPYAEVYTDTELKRELKDRGRGVSLGFCRFCGHPYFDS